jgi:hypothetical protein
MLAGLLLTLLLTRRRAGSGAAGRGLPDLLGLLLTVAFAMLFSSLTSRRSPRC